MPPTTFRKDLADLKEPIIRCLTLLTKIIHSIQDGTAISPFFYYFIFILLILGLIYDIISLPINFLALVGEYLGRLVGRFLYARVLNLRKVLRYMRRILLSGKGQGILIKSVRGNKGSVHVKSDEEINAWIRDVEVSQIDIEGCHYEGEGSEIQWECQDDTEEDLEEVCIDPCCSTDNDYTWIHTPPSTPPIHNRPFNILQLALFEDAMKRNKTLYSSQSHITPPSTPRLSMSPLSSPVDSILLTPTRSSTPLRKSPLTRKGGFTISERNIIFHPVLDVSHPKALDGLERGNDGRMLHGVI